MELLENMRDKTLQSIIREFDVLNDHEELIEPFLMLHHAIAEKLPAKYVYVPGVSVNDGMAYHYFAPKHYLQVEHDFDQDIISAAWSTPKRYGSYQPHLKALDKISTQIFDATKKFHGLDKRQKIIDASGRDLCMTVENTSVSRMRPIVPISLSCHRRSWVYPTRNVRWLLRSYL